jgi:hypothetical protein
MSDFDFQRPARGAYAPGTPKKLFHDAARRQLKLLAQALQLPPGSYEIRSNKAGIAVSGEVTLHGERIYVQAGQGAIQLGLLFRNCNGQKDYIGGFNCWTPLNDLNQPAELARLIKRRLK